MKLPSKPNFDLKAINQQIVRDWKFVKGERLDDFAKAPFKVLAKRGFYGDNKRGIYDDAFLVVTNDGQMTAFNGNTDPSLRRPGIASMMSAQVVWYRPGPHGIGKKTEHPAFRQSSNIIVRRDGGVGNGKPFGSGLFIDSPSTRFWINLHCGGVNSTSSEGCQTVPPSQWPAFHALIHHYLKRYGVKDFPYLLLE